jgi:hypothetical protein
VKADAVKVKQENTDEWLRVVSDDQEGPTLLEDPFAREKVSKAAKMCVKTVALTRKARFIDLITSAFQKESFMPVEPEHSARLDCTRVPLMSQMLVS